MSNTETIALARLGSIGAAGDRSRVDSSTLTPDAVLRGIVADDRRAAEVSAKAVRPMTVIPEGAGGVTTPGDGVRWGGQVADHSRPQCTGGLWRTAPPAPLDLVAELVKLKGT
jgi:hypothetical protein